MTTIKQKIMVLATMMVILCSIASASEPEEHWKGDTNYPLAYSDSFNNNYYVDLSSVRNNKDYDTRNSKMLKYNVVNVLSDTNDITVDEYVILLQYVVENKSRHIKYAFDDKTEKWIRLDPNYLGWKRIAIYSAFLVCERLGIENN